MLTIRIMNNQCFGDNRDLFKYDLIFQTIKRGLVSHFIFIPMLNPDISGNKTTKNEGGQRNRYKAKVGWKNNDLRVFLDKFQDKDKRDIRELACFFREQGIETTIYCGKDKYFSHTRREEYFKQIRNELLRKSLVFVDPDIGLEVNKLTKKHIRYDEIKNLYKRMDESSILMIFQYIPYVKRGNYFPEVSKKLKKKVGDLPIYISDNQIVFFLLTKDNKSLRVALGKVVRDYEKCYPALYVGNIN